MQIRVLRKRWAHLLVISSMIGAAGCSVNIQQDQTTVYDERFAIVHEKGKEGLLDVISDRWIVPMDTAHAVFNLKEGLYGVFHRASGISTGIYQTHDSTYFTHSRKQLIYGAEGNAGPEIKRRKDGLRFEDYRFADLMILQDGKGVARVSDSQDPLPPEIYAGIVNIGDVVLVSGLSDTMNHPDSLYRHIDSYLQLKGHLRVYDSQCRRLLLEKRNVAYWLNQRKDTLFVWHTRRDYKTFEGENYYLTYQKYLSQLRYRITKNRLELIDSIGVDHEKAVFLGNNRYLDAKGFGSYREQLEYDYFNNYPYDSLYAALRAKSTWNANAGKGVFLVDGEPWVVKNQPVKLSEGMSIERKPAHRRRNNILLLHDYSAPQMEHYMQMDDDGIEYFFTSYGEPVQKSGAYDLAAQRWIVDTAFSDMRWFGEFILADSLMIEHIPVDQQRTNEYGDVDIIRVKRVLFDQNGKRLGGAFESDSGIGAIAMALGATNIDTIRYRTDDGTQVVYTYITSPLGQFVVQDDLASGGELVATMDAHTLPESFNPYTCSHIRRHGDAFYLQVHQQIMNPMIYDAHYMLADGFRLKTSRMPFYQGYTYPFMYLDIAEWDGRDFGTSFGVQKLGDLYLINNSTPGSVYDSLIFDEYGTEFNQLRFSPGVFKSGVFNRKEDRWVVPPIYESGVVIGNRLIMRDCEESFDQTSPEFHTQYSYHVFDSVGNERKVFTQEQIHTPVFLAEACGYDQAEIIKAYRNGGSYLMRNAQGYFTTSQLGVSNLAHPLNPPSDWAGQFMPGLDDPIGVALCMRKDTLWIDNLPLPVRSGLKLEILNVYQKEHVLILAKWDDGQQDRFGRARKGNVQNWEPVADSSVFNLEDRMDESGNEAEWYRLHVKGDTLIVNRSESVRVSYSHMDSYVMEYDFYCDDEIWMEENGNWQLKYQNGSIQALPFGWVVRDSFSMKYVYGFEDIYLQEGMLLEHAPDHKLLGKDFKVLNKYKDWNISSAKEMGHFVSITYKENREGMEMAALFDRQGNLISNEYNVYWLDEHNDRIAHGAKYDPFGMMMYDENGNELIGTFRLD